jgi:hypothetical protein
MLGETMLQKLHHLRQGIKKPRKGALEHFKVLNQMNHGDHLVGACMKKHFGMTWHSI